MPSETNATKQKLMGTPFASATELNRAQAKIKLQVWTEVQRAKVKHDLLSKPENKFYLEPFRQGLACAYGKNGNKIVRCFVDENEATQIEINEDMRSDQSNETLLKVLVHAMSQSLNETYMKARDIIPDRSVDVTEETETAPPKKKRK